MLNDNDINFIPGVTVPERETETVWLFAFYKTKLLVELEKDKGDIPCKQKVNDLQLPIESKLYLGQYNKSDSYVLILSEECPLPEGMAFIELRSLMAILPDELFIMAGRAVQIANWYQTHQYCGRCGSKTQIKEGERATACPACGLLNYPRISPAIIVAVRKGNQLLLAHAKHFASGLYSVIAGFVEPGETLEQCVKREVYEEVGIQIANIKYFGSQPWPFPHSLMVAFTAEYASGTLCVDDVEIGEAGWFAWDHLPDIPAVGSVARKLIDGFVQENGDSLSNV